MNARSFLARIAVPALLTLAAGNAIAAGWVDDWFDQSATTQAGHLETQKRGYYTGGGFQGRWRMSNDYLVSVQPPSVKVGCGGVDMFLGGMSYLDGEYIVEKFENILSGVPAFAFELGMQEFCKPCSSAMQTMTEITDYLNSIQVNDCRMSQKVAALAVKGDTSIYDDAKAKAMQGLAIVTGQSKNVAAVDNSTQSNGGKPQVDVRELVNGCPTVFKTVFTNGSVVDNVTNLVGMSQYATLMRGLVGDVYVNYNTSDKNYRTQAVEACPGNEQITSFDLVTGKMEVMSAPGTCSTSGMKAVAVVVSDKLTAIGNKLSPSSAGVLSADDLKFVNAAPIPLLAVMRDSVLRGNTAETIDVLTEPLASAYAFRILDDLHKATRTVLLKAEEVGHKATSNPQNCDITYLRSAIEQIDVMEERSLKYREMARANYAQQQQELMANTAQAQQMLELRRQALKRRAGVTQ